jgi:anaerobic selenocysteine-containing dehydrogenase
VVENGRFTRLEPDPGHATGQALCAKGRAAPELVYHPGRLTQPLRRSRPKGDPDPGWQRINRDEALNLTAAAMRRIAERHGPEAVAFTICPPTTAIGDSSSFVRTLDERLRHPNSSYTLDIRGWGAPSPPAIPTASAVSARAAAAAPCRTLPTAAA